VRTIKDQAVLITGAGRGIGKRLAVGFAAAGARVGLLARSQVELDAAQLEIEHAGGMAIPIRADVRSFEEMCGAVARMTGSFGGVDILIAAAAVQGPIGPLVAADPKAWVEAIEINLIGVMHACRAVLPQMIERRSGKIIVLSGRGAAQPRPNFTAYASSKAALARLVESLAEEVRDHNIQVNCMAPGGTYTAMTDEILRAGEHAGWKDKEDAEEVRLTGGVPPEKQIHLALFLASEQSNHVSGKLIHINDDWKRLERSNVNPGLFTLRRIHKM
jgi:NAD(P)-dependent dehydrogenase (short-subunit alcohol dehydrogenase family)